LKPLNLQAAMYALISQLTLVCNMQLNVLDDLAEAMKALDGKKILKALLLRDRFDIVSITLGN